MPPLAHRAGRLQALPGGYSAYVPSPLPPTPPLAWSAPLWAALSRAERALGWLEAVAERVRVPEGARRAWCRRELVDSVQLDGLRTTVGAVLDLAHRAGEPADEGHPAWEHAPRASRRVILGESALSRALPRVALAPIRSAMLRELHARAMAGSGGEAPGRWREVEVWIGPPGSTIRTARFVPPPPALVPELVARLDAFLAVDGPGPGLVRAALAYHQLETIQPFAEGSGLANRMLVTLLLTETAGEVGGRAGLSRSFLDRPAEYLRCLQAVRERGDWETWVEYFLRGVAEAAHRAAAYLEGLEDMRREHVHMVDRDLGASAASAAVLLESLLCRPVVQVADVARLAGRTFANANQLVGRLVGLGLLRELTGRRRNRRFRYEPYFRLLSR